MSKSKECQGWVEMKSTSSLFGLKTNKAFASHSVWLSPVSSSPSELLCVFIIKMGREEQIFFLDIFCPQICINLHVCGVVSPQLLSLYLSMDRWPLRVNPISLNYRGEKAQSGWVGDYMLGIWHKCIFSMRDKYRLSANKQVCGYNTSNNTWDQNHSFSVFPNWPWASFHQSQWLWLSLGLKKATVCPTTTTTVWILMVSVSWRFHKL